MDTLSVRRTEHVTVCIVTFRREAMLEHLLRCVAAQETQDHFALSAVVIDNDSSGSARSVVERVRQECSVPITYALGAINTIPAARNHAIRLARGNYIAIVDDDEFPSSTWLLKLYRNIQSFGVDGALGPVLPYFDDIPPKWLVRGRFCERPILPTGTRLEWNQTRTGNVLLSRGIFADADVWFDETFTTGGSDREFFKHAMLRGYRFIAVEDAHVYEWVPKVRQTKRYWITRAIVNGTNAHRNSRGGPVHMRALKGAKLLAASVTYLAAAPVCACLGTHRLMQCAERGAHHLSQLCAMAGIEPIKARRF